MSDQPWTSGAAPDEPVDPADLALLAELREALTAVDPVPAPLVEAARASYTWRTVDAELAELVADSALEAAGVRSAGTVASRLLTFTGGEVTVVVEIESGEPGGDEGVRRLTGQVVLPRPGTVEVRQPTGRTTTAVDELGRFSAQGLAGGPTQLHCRLDDGTTLVTDWVTI